MTTRVATCNMRVGIPKQTAQLGLLSVLGHAPDLIGLQEWGGGRNVVLKRLGTFVRTVAGVKLATVPDDGLVWTRPLLGGSPVGADATRFALIYGRRRRLVRAGFVGKMPGRRSVLPASYATVAVFTDLEDGQHTTVVNFHLTAEVQRGKGYRTDKAHARRVKRHKAEVRELNAIVARHQAKGRTVYAVGDSNFDGLAIKGLVSCWDGRNGGTLGSRAVDIVAGPGPSVPTTVSTASDHDAVVATFE